MPPNRNHIAAEIRQAVALGLDDDWELIARELAQLCAKSDPNAGRSILFEFDTAGRRVSDAISRRFVKFLDLCRGYPVRPDHVIEPTAEALRELVQQLRSCGGQRAARAAPFGHSKWILTQSEKAAEFAERALEQARILALQGYAGDRPVFPRSEWPPDRPIPEIAAPMLSGTPRRKSRQRVSSEAASGGKLFPPLAGPAASAAAALTSASPSASADVPDVSDIRSDVEMFPAKQRAVREAARILWPPDGKRPSGLSWKERDKRINDELGKSGRSASGPTIRRALKDWPPERI